jgi:hypothetical protein
MCFSATASFSAAGVLSVIGLLAHKQIRDSRYTMIASVPLLFAVQQVAEGVVWVTMGSAQHQMVQTLAMYVFLFFALCVWPTWMPVAAWLCESRRDKKRMLGIISCLGFFVSLCSIYVLLYNPIEAKIFNCSIWYNIDMQSIITRNVDVLIYAFAVLSPLFISSLPRAKFLGAVTLFSLIFTYVWMNVTLLSVWCFFSAVLSMLFYYSLRLRFPR